MQKNKKINAKNVWALLAGAVCIAAVIFALGACPTSSSDDDNGFEDSGIAGSSSLAPEKPQVTKSQSGFEYINTVDLKSVTDTTANDDSKTSAVIALQWKGEGAFEFNLYHSKTTTPPLDATIEGIKGYTAFVTGLEAETTYYFWIEAINPSGKTVSDAFSKKTGKKGPQKVSGVDVGGDERGDYPRNIKAAPGNGSLTVSWDISDRVGWYEVYYTVKNAVPHIDINATRTFKWNETPYTNKTAYQDDNNQGYTSPIYPFQPDAASGWTGFYVGPTNGTDNDTRPILGIDSFGKAGYPATGTFFKIKEIWKENELGPLQPYKKLDDAFAQATPWDGVNNRAGTPGTPIKFHGTSVTITGLTNGTAYDVWVRCPNVNGERGYGYVNGTPGGETPLPSPSKIRVSTPKNTNRDLNVIWSAVSGADKYRIYTSKFSYTPDDTMGYAVSDTLEYTISSLANNTTLESDTTYYVWIVAEKNGIAGTFGEPRSGKTGTAISAGTMRDKFIDGTSQKIKTAVYIEVNNDNPLNAGSYVLEDGTYLFDYVILFAANIRSRECNGKKEDGYCTKKGPHVHFNDNVEYILRNRANYIKPLQDKGIKVLLGLLGDHDGIGFATMNSTERAAFIADMKKAVEDNGLDGVDFDDEWASKEDWDHWTNSYANISPDSIWTYPSSTWGWPTSVKVYRDPNKGVEKGNGTLTAPDVEAQNRMWKESGELYYQTIIAARTALGNTKTISLYEYNTGRYITAGGEANTTATKDGLQGAIDFALQPWYNQYIEDSANGLPRSIYSPFGMDLSGKAYAAQNGAPNPPISISNNTQATDTIYNYATRFKKAANDGKPYNMLYFYGLVNSSQLLKRQSNETTARVTKEEYISMMSKIVFGKNVVLTAEGGDYRKDW